MTSTVKEQLGKLTEEDLDKILSPLSSLIKELSSSKAIYKSINVQESNKELYEDKITKTLADLNLTIDNAKYTIQNLLYIYQRDSLAQAYKNANNVDDFCEKLDSLLEKLKDKQFLRKLFTGED